MGSGEAFIEFLRDEESRVPTGVFQEVFFEGKMLTIAEILWKYARCELSHEAELHDKISVDFGDFLLDKRGSVDHITFSSELVIRLSYLVETVKENVGYVVNSRFDHLPQPTDLKRAAKIRFRWGELEFDSLAYACSVVSVNWKDDEKPIEWVHMKAHQLMNGSITTEKSMSLLVPIKYVTQIEEGPEFDLVKRRTSDDVGVFPPDKPLPTDSMDATVVRDMIGGLKIELEETVIRLIRPKC